MDDAAAAAAAVVNTTEPQAILYVQACNGTVYALDRRKLQRYASQSYFLTQLTMSEGADGQSTTTPVRVRLPTWLVEAVANWSQEYGGSQVVIPPFYHAVAAECFRAIGWRADSKQEPLEDALAKLVVSGPLPVKRLKQTHEQVWDFMMTHFRPELQNVLQRSSDRVVGVTVYVTKSQLTPLPWELSSLLDQLKHGQIGAFEMGSYHEQTMRLIVADAIFAVLRDYVRTLLENPPKAYVQQLYHSGAHGGHNLLDYGINGVLADRDEKDMTRLPSGSFAFISPLTNYDVSFYLAKTRTPDESIDCIVFEMRATLKTTPYTGSFGFGSPASTFSRGGLF